MQSERWANIGREILFSARSELYMNLPFLDGALAALPVQDGFETSSLATDAKALYFSGAWLAQRFERSRTSVNRAYLHTVFHCLLRHPAKMRGRDRDLWSLACDIAVESLLDSLDYRCLTPDKPSVRRRSLYRSLREHMPVLTAEAVYRHFRRERMNSYDCATLTRVFAVDEHTLWPEDDDDFDEFDDDARPSRPSRSSTAPKPSYSGFDLDNDDLSSSGSSSNTGRRTLGGSNASNGKVVNIHTTAQMQLVLLIPICSSMSQNIKHN